MPAVTLMGHTCSGHQCWPPRPSLQGEPRFTVAGVPVHLQGHAWAPHVCPSTPPPPPYPQVHGGTLASGSARFTVGGRQLGRVGDPLDAATCGSTVAQGEARFTVGD